MKRIALIASALLSLLLFQQPSFAEGRVALVIGNGSYVGDVSRLSNPLNDANLVSRALEKVGFKVTVVKNGTRAQILQAIEEYGNTLGKSGNDAIGFFYYSGHGVSRPGDGTNYVIPVDVKTLQSERAWYDAISLEYIMREVTRLGPNAAHFFVFDACRSELRLPVKALAKGYNDIVGRTGTFIALATSPNQTASDDGEGGGPYSKALAEEIVKPNQDHLSLFQNVKETVYKRTKLSQLPWETNGLFGRVYFNGVGTATPVVPMPKIQALSASIQGKPSSFCEDLKSLTRLAPANFSPIRAAEISGEEWSTPAILSGFSACSIRKVNDTIAYSCQGISTPLDRARKDFSEQIMKFQECLGPFWRKSSLFGESIGFGNSGTSIILSLYDMVELRSSKGPKNSVSNLMIYERPKEAKIDSASLKAPERPQNICESLVKVVQSATESKFENIVRTKPEKGKSVKARVNLNGFNSCHVASLDDNVASRYYSCYVGPMNADDAKKMINDLAPEVGDCLGKDWTVERRQRPEGMQKAEWSSDSTETSVELRPSKNSDQTWDVRVDVNSN